MARTRYQFLKNDPCPYFITATTVHWLPLFSQPEVAQIVLDSLNFLLSEERICLHAYVILENHLHLIASGDDLAKEIARFKSYTARKCIDYYKERGYQAILDQLGFVKLAHKGDRDYQLWQEGSHPERIQDEAMFQQKVDYIHWNPVRRGYVDLPEHWRYSSARDYLGEKGLLPVTVGVG